MNWLVRNSAAVTITTLGLATFAFFQWLYPYHLFHKEQTMLFLCNDEFIAGYLRPAGMACLIGDFLTQFFYYIGGGATIVAATFMLTGSLAYLAIRPLTGKGVALAGTVVIILWEAGRLCGSAYPLSSTWALIGGLALFLMLEKIEEEKIRILCSGPLLAFGYGGFGYGAWICLTGMLLVAVRRRRWRECIIPCLTLFILPHRSDPATSWWGKPDFDREYLLSLDTEYYFARWKRLEMLLQDDHHLSLATFYFNLYHATHTGNPNSSARLPEKLFDYYQPADRGLLLPVGPSSSYLSIQSMGELWYALGDMTMAEHCTMLSMIFSPRHSGSRMIRRLAEINLINGDKSAALKYLRLLEKTLVHRKWARARMPREDQEAGNAPVLNWLESKRRNLPQKDYLRTGDDVVTSLRHLAEKNSLAHDYLLCYHLLRKDLASFWKDYVPSPNPDRIFKEAALICLSQPQNRGNNSKAQFIPSELLEAFADYTRLYEKRDMDLREKYGKTYWFYYHFATITP